MSKEQELKALLENRGTGDVTNHNLAEMMLTRSFIPKYGEMTYDEVILLAKSNQETLNNLPPLDQAFDYFYNATHDMYRYAKALNDARVMGRKDHLIPVHVIVTVNGVTTDAEIGVSRVNYTERRHNDLIRSTILQQLSTSSAWRGSIRHPLDFDFVEL